MTNITPIVAGILYNQQGEILLSSRPQGKAYAGYWEFAGGKVEDNETELVALRREFQEELGIHIHHATPYLTKTHVYEHATVRLRFFRIQAQDWYGTPQAKEQQQFAWQNPAQYTVFPMLPANASLLHTLSLPNQFSGSLKTGFISNNQQYQISTPDLATPHSHLLLTAKQIQQTNGNEQQDIWLFIQQASDLQAVNQAIAAIWSINTSKDAEVLQYTLQQGSPIPICVYAPTTIIQKYQPTWQQLGIHAIITHNN